MIEHVLAEALLLRHIAVRQLANVVLAQIHCQHRHCSADQVLGHTQQVINRYNKQIQVKVEDVNTGRCDVKDGKPGTS